MPIGIPFTWYYKELAVTVWANNRQAAEDRLWALSEAHQDDCPHWMVVSHAPTGNQQYCVGPDLSFIPEGWIPPKEV